FDRSAPLPLGYRLEESDATSWMAFYCLSMLQIALELARTDAAWDDLATKFLEHFLAIARAMNSFGSRNVSLWNEADGFCYDVLTLPEGGYQQLPVRSMVGLLPLLSVALAPDWVRTELPDFTARLAWLYRHRPELTASLITSHGPDGSHLTLSLLDPDRYQRVLHRLLDPAEFLSPFGIRSLSAAYRQPFSTEVAGHTVSISYLPGESDSGLFGGNSNWRGPVWFPVNVLLTDALRTYCAGRGGDLDVEMPTGSGQLRSLTEVADQLTDRLIALFRPGPDGRRPGDPVDVGDG